MLRLRRAAGATTEFVLAPSCLIFQFRGRRVSLGSFYSGIFRPKEMSGLAALSLVTSAPKVGRPAPYEDEFDEAAGRFTYRFRDPQGGSAAAARQAEADNRALVAAHELSVPLIYFRGIAPGQYAIVAPAFESGVLAEGPLTVSLSAVARRWGVSRSHVRRIAQRLERAGLQIDPADSQRYILTPAFRDAIERYFCASYQLSIDAIERM